jgi:hypothetical protein
VKEDREFSARYPDEYRVELELLLKNGDRQVSFSDCPSGDPAATRYRGEPRLLEQEVGRKVTALLAETGYGDRTASLKSGVDALVDAPQVEELSKVLAKVTPAEATRLKARA